MAEVLGFLARPRRGISTGIRSSLETRSSLAARCTRSAREDLVGTGLRGSFVVSLHLVLKSGGKSLHFC